MRKNIESFIPRQLVIKFVEELFEELDVSYGEEAISDRLDRFFNAKPEEEEEQPVQVGILNKPYGLNGYIRAEIGHPVYEYKQRYQFTLEHPNPKIPPYTITFYKETLAPAINFIF